MRRTVIGILAFVTGLLSGSIEGRAQTVERDPITGDFRVTYTALDGNVYTVTVKARDKVDPVMRQAFRRVDGLFIYRYTLVNGASAEQPIFSVDLPCPLEDPNLSMDRPEPWRAFRNPGERDVLSCSFLGVNAPLAAGDTLDGLELVSAWLPELGTARVRGSAPTTSLPSGEDTPDEVEDLVDDLQRPTSRGNWFGLEVLVPSRAPREPPPTTTDTLAALAAASSDADTWIGWILSDLDQVCELGWIDDAGVCSSLRTKLEQARAANTENDTESARQHLQSVLAELEAQHGPGTPMHVNDNAHWLLKTNVEYVLSWL